MPKKPLNIRINEELLGQLKDLAEENHTSLTSVIESFCRYGIQHNLSCKEFVYTNVAALDESQIQQRIQEAVDTTVEAKVKTVEDRLNAAIEERLEVIATKTQHLTEENCKELAKILENRRNKRQSHNNAPQRTDATQKDVAPSESVNTSSNGKYEGGITQGKLCEMFGIDASNIAKTAKSKGKTPQQYLMEKTGWVFRDSDRKYYPPAK